MYSIVYHSIEPLIRRHLPWKTDIVCTQSDPKGTKGESAIDKDLEVSWSKKKC